MIQMYEETSKSKIETNWTVEYAGWVVVIFILDYIYTKSWLSTVGILHEG
jgi:hypothetical protein